MEPINEAKFGLSPRPVSNELDKLSKQLAELDDLTISLEDSLQPVMGGLSAQDAKLQEQIPNIVQSDIAACIRRNKELASIITSRILSIKARLEI